MQIRAVSSLLFTIQSLQSDMFKPDHQIEDQARHISPIKTFFANANIFLTGGTGFLGILLLEKLLLSCPNVTIYMLVRRKKGKNAQIRLDDLFNDVVFSRLKKEVPNFREQVIQIEGDCALENLGLSTQDQTILIKEVNIVFHIAATVKFDETLKKASLINIRATRDLLRLAQKMQNLTSFVHVSTAYSNCVNSRIKEEVYPPPSDYNQLLNVVEALPEDILSVITPKLLKDYPNAYVFTKQIGEDVVAREGAGLPIGIHRPSIVMSTYHEPLRGWFNNFNGPTAYFTAGGLGIVRAIRINKGVSGNLVPADMVVNSMIAAAWDIAENSSRNKDDIPVYNFEDSQGPRLTTEYVIELGWKKAFKYCTNHIVMYMLFAPCRNELSFAINKFFLHKLPAIFVDVGRICIGQPPILLKVYRKIDRMADVWRYFMLREWIFESGNVSKLKDRMSEADSKTFFCEMKNFDWEEYFDHYVKGIRVYFLKDPLETLPKAQKKLRSGVTGYAISMYSLMEFVVVLAASILNYIHDHPLLVAAFLFLFSVILICDLTKEPVK